EQAGKAKGSARSSMASLASTVQDDVKQLAMSTLSFQEYVRERMIKRRQAALTARMEPELAQSPEEQLAQRVAPARRMPEARVEQQPAPDTDVDLSAPALRLVKSQREEMAEADAAFAAEQRVAQARHEAAQQARPAARPGAGAAA